MDEKLENFKHLLEEKQLAMEEYNQYIIDYVSDTVGSAIHKLLNVPREHITWENIEIVGIGVLFECTFTYSPLHEPSEFLRLIDSVEDDESPLQVQRSLTLGIPLSMLFKPADIIHDFMLDVARGTDPLIAAAKVKDNVDETPKIGTDHTSDNLTEQQIQQILFFQQETKGIIQ